MVAILVLLTVIIFLTVDYFVQRGAQRRAAAEASPAGVPTPADLSEVPGGVFLAPGHAWVELRPRGSIRLGADRLAPSLLGGIDHVDLVPAGSRLRRGDVIARLAKGGRSVELRAPVDGTVRENHFELTEHPAELERDPFAAWLVELVPERLASALKGMLVAEEARAYMRRELARLRDALFAANARLSPAPATAPDGGLPAEGVAHEVPEEVWAELEERFFGGVS